MSGSSLPGKSGDKFCVDGRRHDGIYEEFLSISLIRFRALDIRMLVQPPADTMQSHTTL